MPSRTRRASTRKSSSRRSRRRWRRPRARSTASCGTCASPSTARPATTRPSAAGRCSPTIRARSRIRSAELRLEDALDIDKAAVPGGYVEEPMESAAFGRIAAQQAKQVIVQKVREAERAQVVEQYKDRVGTLVSGVVKRIDRNGIYVDLGGNAEGFVPRSDMIPREQLKPQDRVKAFLQGGARRAARPAAVPDAHRAGIPDRAVQARSAGSRPGHDPDPRRRARSGRPRQDRRARATIRASIRSAPASACAVRACRRCRTRSPASASTSFRSTTTRRSSSSTPCRRPKCSRSSSTRTRTAWTSRWPRTSCRRPSAAAARTSASPASSPAGNSTS